jgi:hypothetical protein
MGYIEKRTGHYRVRFRDPLGRQRSETFTRKADADCHPRGVQVEMERGRWLDPRGAEMALATWAEEFLSLARRISPLTQEAYRRDIDTYVLPRFGAYRIGRLPADEIENWLNDEVAASLAPSSVHRHYRTLRRMLQVAVEKERILANPCVRVQPPRVPHREWWSSTGRTLWSWPRRTGSDTGRSSTLPTTRGCAGASWSDFEAQSSMFAPLRSG